MNLCRKILFAIGIVLIGIQFIQPARNKSNQVFTTDISNIVTISDSVQAVLKNACFDCHSNNTSYPFYSNFQPIGWFMANHIKQGKEELNFSEFGSYSPRKQLNKLNGVANSIRDGIMPLSSYKLMHKNAQLHLSEKMLIINWAEHSKDSLSEKIK